MKRVYVVISIYMTTVYDVQVFSTYVGAVDYLNTRRAENSRSTLHVFRVDEKEIDNPDFK